MRIFLHSAKGLVNHTNPLPHFVILFGAIMAGVFAVSAYDFEYEGLFYNILSEEDKTAELTHPDDKAIEEGRDSLYNSKDYLDVDVDIILPPEVSCSDRKYTVVAIGKRAMHRSTASSITIPETVIEIKDSAFYSSRIAHVKFPNYLKKIGAYAFSTTSLWNDVDLPESLEEIGKHAFSYNFFGTFVVPEGVKKIGTCAFCWCYELSSVVLPRNLEKIEDSMFSGCYWLHNVTLPVNLKEIGNSAFRGTGVSKDFKFPPSLKIIGDMAFSDVLFKELPNLDSVEWIGDRAFESARLDTLTIPAKLSHIGEGAFQCIVDAFQVSPDNKAYISRDGCLYSASMDTLLAVPRKKNDIIIPDGVKRIGAFSFFGNISETVTLPQSVSSIGKGAFNASWLRSIKLPDEIDTIPEDAFRGCDYLIDVHFPEKLKCIMDRAFFESFGCARNNHYRLDMPETYRVTLPENLDSLGYGAFWSCFVDTVISKNPIPPKTYNNDCQFFSANTLIVPVSSKGAYSQAPAWREIKNIIEMDLLSVDMVMDNDIELKIENGVIRINGKKEDMPVAVYDLAGRLVHYGVSPTISGLANGTYIIKVGSVSKKVNVK